MHIRSCQVENHPPVEIDGVSDDQQKILQRRSNSTQPVEEQWYFLWETLFPAFDRPANIYLDEVYSNQIICLREFMNTEGAAIFRNFVNAHGGISWKPPANETDVDRFKESVFREVLDRVFKGWSDHCTTGVADPRQASTPALPARASATTPSQSNCLDLMESQSYTDSSTSFYKVSSVAGGAESTNDPESEFDYFIDVLGQQ
ncbi:hypothetical protein NPX13_g3674 [Xylaria arbuscula]|uniref:Uncharacterized protein n=1 Tax=Xylaria arbuscula TaxID=114810 RepID=A0A9W8TML4_9PEZI|nr:hypothetical protein NPX13_g3674 [Xylaria arbuscula]